MGGGVKSRRVGRVCGADVTARLSRAVTSAPPETCRADKHQ
jgi:hypothetical protein